MSSNTAREPLPPAYEPSSVEGRIYEMWESRDYFKPRMGGDPYCIIMPPPNVTGELHLGHGLEDAITDTLVRWHRMRATLRSGSRAKTMPASPPRTSSSANSPRKA
jgi:valyl-tRNA synthetase